MRAQVVLLEDDRVLMVRLERPGRSFWVLPGGAVESDETVEEAAIREVWEETGIRIELERLLLVEEPRMSGNVEIKRPRHTFLARAVGGRLSPDYGEIAEAAWLPFDSPKFDASTRDTLSRVRGALSGV